MKTAVEEVAGVSAEASEFEARRLAWFAAQGFEGPAGSNGKGPGVLSVMT